MTAKPHALPSESAIELILGCRSWQEAQQVADHLLEKQLVACVEFMETAATQLRHHAEQSKEVKLIMESVPSNQVRIEAEIHRLLSDDLVLQAVPIATLSHITDRKPDKI